MTKIKTTFECDYCGVVIEGLRWDTRHFGVDLCRPCDGLPFKMLKRRFGL